LPGVKGTLLSLAENGVERPAAAHMRAGAAQVVENLLVRASSVFEGVAEDRKVLERLLPVNRVGDTQAHTAAVASPGVAEEKRAERPPHDVPEKDRLMRQSKSLPGQR